MEITPEILERLQALDKKYQVLGQDMLSYLDGLLYSNYVTYWDYIHLDTLLSLQHPKTDFPDEEVFIMYHQITELYFKLIIHEIKQIAATENLNPSLFTERMIRINRYFEALTHSFAIMIDGMEQKQFLKFRMSLLPASGFQSAQYRTIEILSTDFYNLIDKDSRNQFQKDEPHPDIAKMYEHLYWHKGATELATGKKTLTLKQFEEKYSEQLIAKGKEYITRNLYACFRSLGKDASDHQPLVNAFRNHDILVNINWPLAHYRSAARYLQKDPEDIKATGGTNWQKYLPPRFQKRIFYPGLWTEKEKDEWGKKFVESLF
jgi:tryptophan 2,3-dioxygenase